MKIKIFRRPYTIRKHGPQTVEEGYASAAYADSIIRLNVQPQAPDDTQADPSGDHTVIFLKSWGSDRLTSANDNTGIPGDMLFYNGLWYECTSSVMWDHTMLAHYQSDFVVLPAEKQEPPPEVKP